MDWTSIIVALITATASVVTVVIQSRKTNVKIDGVKKDSRKDAIRNQVLTMIMSDKLNVMNGGLPENYKDVCELMDEYTSEPLNGNSWVKGKFNEYQKWVESLETKKK